MQVYFESLIEKIEELFSEGGELRWLYLALTRKIPAPYILTENPTMLQIITLKKVAQIYAVEIERK